MRVGADRAADCWRLPTSCSPGCQQRGHLGGEHALHARDQPLAVRSHGAVQRVLQHATLRWPAAPRKRLPARPRPSLPSMASDSLAWPRWEWLARAPGAAAARRSRAHRARAAAPAGLRCARGGRRPSRSRWWSLIPMWLRCCSCCPCRARRRSWPAAARRGRSGSRPRAAIQPYRLHAAQTSRSRCSAS